jgi:protein-L-isoaspartate(D-aspartate) O-methyltransferase
MPSHSPRNPYPGAAIAHQMQQRGINDPRLLEAMARISRERFLPPDERQHALDDRAIPIGHEQTISQPFIVAVMTRELRLTGTERVLEIGTGSGYQTAVLSDLASQVFTIERLETLSLRARSILDGLGRTNIHYRIGDGTLGWPAEGPFDRIIVTAGAPGFPLTLFDQLIEGGLLVAPVGNESSQELTIIQKRDGRPKSRKIMPCRFVKLIGAEGWADHNP